MAGKGEKKRFTKGFLRDVLFQALPVHPYCYCHRPIIVKDTHLRVGEVLWRLKAYSSKSRDDVIDRDIILVWEGEQRRVITGADILGRLLKGI
jgi:hypothetical protein